ADIEEITLEKPVDVKSSSFPFMVIKSWFGMLPGVKERKFDPSKYDLLVLGAPIWMGGGLAAPLKTYIKRNRGSFPPKLAFFMSCGGFRMGGAPGTVERLSGKKLVGSLILREKEEMLTGTYEKKVKEFAASLKKS
ncbi:MAG: hypothetical protein ABIF01_03650, partial [Candidatus Micrarchaeota archaeon]